MKIQVRYFAVFRERLGCEEEALDVEEAATVGDVIATLAKRHDVVERLVGRFRVAVNREMVTDDHVVVDGDEVALIPPVAGGSHVRLAAVLDAPLSLDRVVAAVSSAESGGVVTFTGQVRRKSQGRDVVKLEYEAYAEMAEAVFVRLCEEIESEFEGVRLAVEHRVGTLEVGDVAVVIAAAAPHRAEAFAAARAMIDRLKDDAPIWKKETGSDGSEWVGLGP